MFHPYLQGTVTVYGPSDHLALHFLFYRLGLPCKHGFVQVTFSFGYDTVRWHFFARFYQDQISLLKGFKADILDFISYHLMGFGWEHTNQKLKCL